MSASAINVHPVVHRAIHEALADREGGEVIVRTGNHVGRLYVCREAIAWVTCDTVRTRLRDILEEEAGIERDTLNAVVDECQQTRQNFGETLLAWGLLEKDTLRQCLLRHNATHFMGIVGLGQEVESMFVPRARHYAGSLLFPYEEVVQYCETLHRKHSSILPPAGDASAQLSDVYLQIPDCRALVVIDTRRRVPVAIWPPAGLSLAEEVVVTEAALQLLEPSHTPLARSAPTRDDPTRDDQREVMVIGPRELMLVRRCGPERAVVALCQDMVNFGMTLGMARNVLPSACLLDVESTRLSLV